MENAVIYKIPDYGQIYPDYKFCFYWGNQFVV